MHELGSNAASEEEDAAHIDSTRTSSEVQGDETHVHDNHDASFSPLMASDSATFNTTEQLPLQNKGLGQVAPDLQHVEAAIEQHLQKLREKKTKAKQPDDDSPPWSIFFGSIANLCSATLGAGVLSLPFALYQSGLVGGFFLLAVSAWASIVSIRFLVQASDEYGIYTYEGLVQHVLGSKAKRLVELAMVIFCGGCAVAYVMAVGDILSQVVPQSPTTVSICLVWGIAMLPLSLLRRMESLQWASGIGVASIVTLVAAVLVHFGEDSSRHVRPDDLTVKNLLWPATGFMSLVRACPMVIFAFSCQVNVCAIYHELPSQETTGSGTGDKTRLMQNVTLSSVLGCATLYAVISTFALFDFGAMVQPNVLVNYCPRGIMHVAFGCMALAVVMAFPLNVFPARVAIESMMRKENTIEMAREGSDSHALEEPLLSQTEEGVEGEDIPNESSLVSPLGAEMTIVDNVPFESDFSLCRHVALTLGIAGSALALALVVPDISIIFGLLGGTTSSALGFVIPGCLGRSLRQHGQSSIQAWILIVGGTIVGILTTGVTIWSSLVQQTTTQPIPDACSAERISPTASPTTIEF